jgi:hypothetical protein
MKCIRGQDEADFHIYIAVTTKRILEIKQSECEGRIAMRFPLSLQLSPMTQYSFPQLQIIIDSFAYNCSMAVLACQISPLAAKLANQDRSSRRRHTSWN